MKPDLSAAAHGLAHPTKKDVKKHLKELHVRELHDGSHHVSAHDGKGGVKESSASDLDQVHDLMEEHMGQPNDGEEMAEGE